MIVRVLARANSKVGYSNGKKSVLPFHASPDGSAVIPLDSGYVYVSNSELSGGNGGVYGLYFDHEGNVVDYKALLRGTTRNCSGGEYSIQFVDSFFLRTSITNICDAFTLAAQ